MRLYFPANRDMTQTRTGPAIVSDGPHCRLRFFFTTAEARRRDRAQACRSVGVAASGKKSSRRGSCLRMCARACVRVAGSKDYSLADFVQAPINQRTVQRFHHQRLHRRPNVQRNKLNFQRSSIEDVHIASQSNWVPNSLAERCFQVSLLSV